MKSLSIIVTLLLSLFVESSMAQSVGKSGNTLGSLSVIHKAHIDPQAGQAWWGYFTDDGQYADFGTEGKATYNCAIRIPGDHEIAKGSKIYAERLWLKRSANYTNMKIWMSTKLPASADKADVCCKAVDVTKGGIVDFAFDEPYQLDSKGVYIGYTFTIENIESDDDKWPVYTTSGLDMIQNAMFVSWSGSAWYSNYDLCNSYGGNWGNLAMQVLLGDGFHSNAAGITEVGEGVVALGGTVSVPVTLENFGGNDLFSFDYTVKYDGKEAETFHYDTGDYPIIGTLNTQKYYIPLTAGNVVGESKATVKIIKVNDVDNELNDGREQGYADVLTVARHANRMTVMENFINTSDDGYSALSHVANERLNHDWHNEFECSVECGGNHDNYIGIMIHDGDKFATADYPKTRSELLLLKETTQNPFIYTDIDRESRVLNYFGSQYFDQYNRRTKFGIEDDFGTSQQKDVEAYVQLWTKWKNTNTIECKVGTTFLYSTDNAHYALAFALVEDGKTGTINNTILPMTKQSGVFEWDPYVWNTYVNGASVVRNVEFNDVLVATEGIENGIAGSISAPIKQDETQYYQQSLGISRNSYISNKNKLKIIAILLDTKSGRIVNANWAHAGEDSTQTGIKCINADNDNASAKPDVRYDIYGRRVNNDYKGIVIVNGEKVIVR